MVPKRAFAEEDSDDPTKRPRFATESSPVNSSLVGLPLGSPISRAEGPRPSPPTDSLSAERSSPSKGLEGNNGDAQDREAPHDIYDVTDYEDSFEEVDSLDDSYWDEDGDESDEIDSSSAAAHTAVASADTAPDPASHQLDAASDSAEYGLGDDGDYDTVSDPPVSNHGTASEVITVQDTTMNESEPTTIAGINIPSATEAPKRRTRFLPNAWRHQSGSRRFNLITALCRHVDVLVEVISWLPPKATADLFSISAPFHYQFCSRQTQFILAGTRIWAPNAATLLPWRYFPRLCASDPGLRLPSDPTLSTTGIRLIPTLRWLRMVVHHRIVGDSILAHLHAQGLPLPTHTSASLQKLWFMLTIPLSAPRISLIRNESYFAVPDLWCLTAFFLKLDMALTDPIKVGTGGPALRKMLLSEPGLGAVWDMLRRSSRVDALRLFVKYRWTPTGAAFPTPRNNDNNINDNANEDQEGEEEDAEEEESVMGIPLPLCGRGGNELHGRGAAPLIRPDDLVMREGIRRGLQLERETLKMMRWGVVSPDTLEVVDWADKEPREVVRTLGWGRRSRRQVERGKRRARHSMETGELLALQNREWEGLRRDTVLLGSWQEAVD